MTMTEGQTLLLGWLRRSKTRRSELAERLGITRPYMTQITKGLRRPGLELMIRIEFTTGIPVIAWTRKRASELDTTQIDTAGKSRVSNELTDTAWS